jgi:hypothetical protein
MAVAVSEVERRSSPVRRTDEENLNSSLIQALALVQQAEARAFALTLSVIGDVELPELTPSTPEDQAQIRAIAPLYLAAQLEEAGLLPAVETLSGLAFSGALQSDLGDAAGLIEDFWQERNRRFHENERRALYARLFGAESQFSSSPVRDRMGSNDEFENVMIDLAESLYKLGDNSIGADYGSPLAQTRLLTTTRNLAENLLNRSGGMTAFAASEILNTIQAAVQILRQPAVQRAVGGRSLWTSVRAIATRYLHRNTEISAFVTRGKSGLVLLSWVADTLPQLNANRPLTTLDHPVVAAASEWLEASLTVREAAAETGG